MSTHARGVPRTLRTAALVMVLAICVAGLAAPAAVADTTALTDDTSVAVPTSWWTYTNATVADVNSRLSANGARLTDVERYDSTGRLTVTMVRNSGSYAVPGWWWYVGLTAAQVSQQLSTNGGRLIDIDGYAVDGSTRFNVVMVSNTGSAARSWYWYHGYSQSQINAHVSNTGYRLTDIDEYVDGGGATRYAIISVANTGADAKSWQYWYGQTAAQVGTRISDFGGRLVDLGRRANGTFNMIQVRNSSTNTFSWWWYKDLTSMSQANSVATQLGARIFNVETYTTPTRRYAVLMINNSNAATSRIRGLYAPTLTSSNGLPKGRYGGYINQVGPAAASTSLNASGVFEPASALKALHHLHAMRAVQAGDDALTNSFTYYNYPNSPYNASTANACPIGSDETTANDITTDNLGEGLRKMMVNSDNRTTRGVVLRYGGLTPLNQTAATVGMSSTFLRQQMGCGYDGGLRNDTTLVDLGKLYEGVHNGTLLSGTPQTEFFNKMGGGAVRSGIVAIINDEAAKQSKSGIATSFRNNTSYRLKGGSYNICRDSASDCTRYLTRSEAGRIVLPYKSGSTIVPRYFVFGSFISDVPVSSFSGTDATAAINAYSNASNELFREKIREALTTW